MSNYKILPAPAKKVHTVEFGQESISVQKWGTNPTCRREHLKLCRFVIAKFSCACVCLCLPGLCASCFFWPSWFLCRVYCTTDSWRGSKCNHQPHKHAHTDHTRQAENNKHAGSHGCLYERPCATELHLFMFCWAFLVTSDTFSPIGSVGTEKPHVSNLLT